MDGAGLDRSVEAEVWELLDQDESVAEDTIYLVATALQGDEELADQLGGDRPAPQRPAAVPTDEPTPLRAFLRSITVSGFRGIGTSAKLELNPYCGITVISGRNGSGKSSFAEALEYALTGTSYRWEKKKGQHWQASWRNLHAGDPASITVDFAMEPDDHRTGTTATVGVEWASGCKREQGQSWSQIKGQRREPVSALGWDHALSTHRPLMSYDELGGLFEEGQSALYDALNVLLNLDAVSAADARLKAAEKRLGDARKTANEARTQLIRTLDGCSDPRAAEVKKLIARKPYDLDAVTATTLGTKTDQAAAIARLQTIAGLEVPELDKATEIANELRAAIEAHAGTSADDVLVARANLLRDALHLHADTGDGVCPVCETGVLDVAWRAAAEERLKQANEAAAAYSKVAARLKQARTVAEGFFGAVTAAPSVDGVELAALSTFNEALTKARTAPGNVADLPAHVETAALELTAAADVLRREASERATELEDAWSPFAHSISAWVGKETDARRDDVNLDRVKAAVMWLRSAADTLRERRMAPMVSKTSELWERMRHESNVDIGNIALEGSATRRHVVVDGAVDGVSTGALSVMSQGELHALALAMFIPRATNPESPFRFLVLDDPIQAMDPAKIAGFLDVLVELGKTRQVIVFSHDDRLPAAIRARSVPAQLLDVTREQGSLVVVKENDLPADRYVADAEALILDDDIDDLIKRKAAPGLFRMAIEAAAHQRYFGERAKAGAAYHETDTAWEEAKTTQRRVALTLTGAADGDVSGWKSHRQYRFPTIAISASGTHRGATLDRGTIRDLRDTVHDIVAGQ
ncbi:RecF/RecN/SMC N-terminal domain-containing protein [Mycobacteroides abscessus subsp. abscessus]|uniref:AAA family ATPase n=1 Tax=Mycobacteroides abscessus TaxID=36809 RepID=UPI000925D110|nr:AAA family ATPase [Mycobacteroides abscessus]SHX66805.1 RecF/RecN/SMC N-terminal domain-containing protein [Mycobacteroides abscessus subsp. abscessus]SIC59756.1 RecF/RecN/SMC N-terminal domain-containing protein [Mycobacteroides abscessus subsp. abscessus]SKK20492.1 RecF/RecN/SMC N-terminal domain-containing protein [Mycobacteroides abscessus subsp. abscessus]SKP50221.1 RecF/RecN/SMC N-terminal domain-containing protein [Mycobacteroides abscessus subsp. abscessus]SKR41867.1 RecF/RecN/SMC N